MFHLRKIIIMTLIFLSLYAELAAHDLQIHTHETREEITGALFLSIAHTAQPNLTVPHPALAVAEKAYSDGKITESDVDALLQVMLLEYSSHFMRENYRYLMKTHAKSLLLPLFKQARKRVASIKWRSAYEIYQHAEEQTHLHLKNAWHSAWQHYPHWAAGVSYRMEMVEKPIDPAILKFEYEQIFIEAQKGLRPAMLLFAHHYKNGQNLEKSPFKSLFWFQMAAWEGAGVENEIERLAVLVSESEKQKIQSMMNVNEFPDLWVQKQ